MTRAIVIKKMGDTGIADAIADGMALTIANTNAPQADNGLKEAEEGVRKEGDKKRWKRTKRRLARKYSIKPVGPVRGAILGVWGLIWLRVFDTFDYLSRWNRTGVRG